MIRGTKRPRVKAVEIIEPKAQKIDAKLNSSIHNRFDIEVVDAATGKIKQRAQAENIILNALWTRLLTPNTYFNYIFFGTGSGTPAATDTALFTHLGYKAVATPTCGYDWDDGWVSLRQQCQLIESEYVGSTLTEVGIGYGTSSSNLVTHAMLKDMNGNAISIAKTDTDIINIYATVFVHWGSATQNTGLSYPLPPMGVTSGYSLFDYLLGTSTSCLSGLCPVFTVGGIYPLATAHRYGFHDSLDRFPGVYVASNAVTRTYNAPSKTIQFTATRLAVSKGNVSGGIGAVYLEYTAGNSSVCFYTSMICLPSKVGGNWFTGTAITGEAIATGDGNTKDFATDFDRIQAGAKIYVNGVEQTSGVTVDTDKPFLYNNMGVYFELIDGSPTGAYLPAPIEISTYTEKNVGAYSIYYNPYYSYGIKSFTRSNVTVHVSNDLSTWVDITSQSSNVAAAYRTYKYWKLTATDGNDYIKNAVADTIASANNIHFDTAPASGAVITADYTTKTIAKDVNHVFDLTVTIQLGEYTE